MRNDHEISLRIISIHWVVLTMRKMDKILYIYSNRYTQDRNELSWIQLKP